MCLSIKATHLELVADVKSQAFTPALRIFTARGLHTNIYRDNRKNFVGANRELKELLLGTRFKENLHKYSL